MCDPDDFPYLAEAADPRAPAVPESRPWPCPFAPEGECAWLLRPRSRAELMRAAGALRGQAGVRCLLLAPPDGLGPWPAILPGDLAAWAPEAESRLGLPVRLLTDRSGPPCGGAPACRGHAGEEGREGVRALARLAVRAESLGAALDAAFPGLPPRSRRILQEWAHLDDPRHRGRPITAPALGARHRLSDRQIRRVLAAARAENPALFATLRELRVRRAHRTGGWVVRET